MPLINIAVVLLILGLGYYWAGQGLFSALIHFLCVLVAGAVAFAVWEPLTYGVLLNAKQDIAWSVGLLAPFLATLALLRVLTNKLIPVNMDFDNTTNFIGGGLFGALSGVLTAGLIVISIGFLQLPPDFLGYRAVNWERSTGAIDARNGSPLWVPADKITTKVFEMLSAGAFSTGTPLAQRMPNVYLQGDLLRTTYEDRSRTTLSPDDFTVLSRYTVKANDTKTLLSDSFVISADGSPAPQRVSMPDGSSPPAGSQIEGYVIQFNAGAKEKKGQTVVGPGQIRLVVDTPQGALSLGPIAFITRSSGSTLQVNRYRFDAPEVYAATVGGASQATMTFEFVVPPDATPMDLLVKNVRTPVATIALSNDGITPAQRDDLVKSGSIIGVTAQSAAAPTVLNDSNASSGPTSISPASSGFGGPDRYQEIRESRALGFTFNKQSRGNMNLNDKNRILDGSVKLIKEKMGASNIAAVLRVNAFEVPAGTTMVQVNIGAQSRMSVLGRSLDTAELVLPPTLRDTIGQQYQAVGYIYEDSSRYEIRFTPGQTIRGLSQIPALSRSRSDQKLTLLFLASKGVSIETYGLGSQVKIELDPPLKLRD